MIFQCSEQKLFPFSSRLLWKRSHCGLAQHRRVLCEEGSEQLFPAIATRNFWIIEFEQSRHNDFNASVLRRAIAALAKSGKCGDESIASAGSVQNIVFRFLARLPFVQCRL